MPTSDFSLIPAVLDVVSSLTPKSICDIGVGCGKYGLLFREALDLPDCADSEWKGTLFAGNLKLDGVEVYANYIGPIQQNIYDHIYTGNICDLTSTLAEYDLFTMIDVIEHLEVADALAILDRLRAKARIGILIATPVHSMIQHKIAGNEHERHLSCWSADLWRKLGRTRYRIVGREWLALVEGREPGCAPWLTSPRFRRKCRVAAIKMADTFFPGRLKVPWV